MRNAVSDGQSSAAQPPQQHHAGLSPQAAPIDGSMAHSGMKISQ